VEAFDILPPVVHHRHSALVTGRMLEEAQRHSQSYLSRVREGLRSIGIAASVATLPGAPARAITDWAGHEPDALAVMSTHGRGGIARWALGSVADKVLHSIPNPVLLIRSGSSTLTAAVEPRTVLVPLDGSELSELSLPHAASVATALGARIALLRVTATSDFYRLYLEQEAVGSGGGEWMSADELVRTDSQEAQASLDRAKRRLAIEFGFAHEVTVCHLQGQNPAEAIVEMAAAEPTLVVMTTHGRSGINRLVLGSVTDRVVRHANAPVLVVRKWDEPGFTGVEERVSQGYSAGFGNAAAQPA
jgi:nucleotide-binding universal stress UspA family protein